MKEVKCEFCGEKIKPEDSAYKVDGKAIHHECADLKEYFAGLGEAPTWEEIAN